MIRINVQFLSKEALRSRIRYYTNPEKWNSRTTRYQRKHRDKQRIYVKRHYYSHEAQQKINRRIKYFVNLPYKYGISEEDYNRILSKQDGKCAICKKPLDRPYVDHNHITKCARGLLCKNCNFGLGQFKDSPEILRKASEYLERYN